MDVRCERCQTEYEVEDASVSDLGTEVQCSDCGHLFVVRRPEAAASQASGNREPDGQDAGAWVIETAAGRTLRLHDLTTLHKWIIERRVTREDRILRDQEPWQRLGDSAELMQFFDIVDSAERARTADTPLPAALPAPLAPPVLEPPAAMPQAPSPERSPFQAPSAPPRRLVPTAATGKPTAPFQGASPNAVDLGATQIIHIKPARTHVLLKLFLTMLVAAVVAYAGILWQHHRLRSAMISSSGTAEDATAANSSAAGLRAPTAPTPAESSEAAAESPEGDGSSAHGPVVEPIVEDKRADTLHLLGRGKRPAGTGKPTLARKAKSEPSAHSSVAIASAAKPNAPAALAAQGYVALNHRQFAQAISLFKRALAGNPSNGTALFGLAEAYRGGGQPGLALQSYRRYVEILPFGPDAGSSRFQIRTLESKRR